MLKKTLLLPLAAAVLSAVAFSQTAYGADDPYTVITRDESRVDSEIGISFLIGGGLANFTNTEARRAIDLGGMWTARAIFGTRSRLGFEVAYLGSANDIDVLGLDSRSILTSHGAEALLRLNLVNGPLQPYLFGGATYKRYSLTNDQFNASTVRGSDSVFESPFGAGVALVVNGFVLDGRFDYRPAYDEDLFASNGGLDNWNVSGRVGFEF